jgi:hypothetical protein
MEVDAGHRSLVITEPAITESIVTTTKEAPEQAHDCRPCDRSITVTSRAPIRSRHATASASASACVRNVTIGPRPMPPCRRNTTRPSGNVTRMAHVIGLTTAATVDARRLGRVSATFRAPHPLLVGNEPHLVARMTSPSNDTALSSSADTLQFSVSMTLQASPESRPYLPGNQVTTHAMCLPGVDSQWRHSTRLVFGGRHRLKMRRIHAMPNAAQMIEMQAIGYRSIRQLIGHAVRECRPLRRQGEVAISVLAPARRPQPTAVRLIDARPKSVSERLRDWSQRTRRLRQRNHLHRGRTLYSLIQSWKSMTSACFLRRKKRSHAILSAPRTCRAA